MSWHGHVLLDVLLLEELRQIFARKLRAVVGDDELRDDNQQMMFLHTKHSMFV